MQNSILTRKSAFNLTKTDRPEEGDLGFYQPIGEDVLHDNVELVLIKNVGKLFSNGQHIPPAASELGFALCNKFF